MGIKEREVVVEDVDKEIVNLFACKALRQTLSKEYFNTISLGKSLLKCNNKLNFNWYNKGIT